ncbi:predicted protein [Naegleria gruberi]|uniref:Predicted protein n=1 Tax=Naegleria gruberi TaxID=5762 RepID=D2VAM0_NAEGR|nr:uncharacterized protein NAEGRDRAFT_47990 [Naegleria gruberi]EFC46100.1 predicted protein [Naegleria gruberi]|eukprot:XP_002678844.1 predicted protein [Naegleria gruberi strain NEG-M]
MNVNSIGRGREQQFPSPSTSSTSSNFTTSNVIPSPSLSSIHNLLSSGTTAVVNSGNLMHVVKDLPQSMGFFAVGTEKTRANYPLLPEIVLRIVNCDRLMDKCKDEESTCFLSCHIAATKRSDPSCNDIFTFSEFPLNTNIKLSDLITQSYTQEFGGCTQAVFKPKGFVLNLHDTSVYSKFTIKFQLILDQKNTNKVLIDQVNTNSFEAPIMSLTMKEDFDDNTKYIIGSLANRSDELIKHGSKKIAAPVTVKFSPTFLDHFVKNMKKELYAHFYIRGEDGDDKDISYCLMKHDRIKIKPNVYTYQLDKNLGRLDNGEKKPQKDRFRLGVVLCTKFLALPSNKFTKRMLKYKYPTQPKSDPSLLYWIETKPFQSAKRQDICKPKRKAPEDHSDEEGSNESHSTHLTSPPQNQQQQQLATPQISPKLVTDLKEILSARILNQMYEKDPQKSALLEDFIHQSQLLLQVYNQLHNTSSGSIQIVSYKFDKIYPTEGHEGTPVAVISSKELHQDAKFIVTFGGTKLSYSGGITSKHSIGFTVPPKPNANQNSYVVTVCSRDAYVQVQEPETEMIFTYAEDRMVYEAAVTTQVQQDNTSMLDLLNGNGAVNQIQSPFDDEFLDLNDCFTNGDFNGVMEYFEHNSICDLVTERDSAHNRLPMENARNSGQLELIEKVVPVLYEYWLDELQNLTLIAKELLVARTEREISVNLEKASRALSKLNIDEQQEVEETIVSSPTNSPSILISSSPNSLDPKDSTKLTAGKIHRKSSFREMITKLFTVDSNMASADTSDDIKDIMTEITTSPKHVMIAKFEPITSTKILQATEEPIFKNPDSLNNLSNLKSKLERFENEVDPKGIDTIVKTLGDSSSILTSYFLKESNLTKLTVQLSLYQENVKKGSKPSTNKSDFEETFHCFDLSIQLNEKTTISWDSARGIAKIVSKPSMNKLFAVFDILTLEGKSAISNFVQKLSMTIAYWNVNQNTDATGQQFIESILLETGYISSCKPLFDSFSNMVLGSNSHDKVIRRKIKLPKDLSKGFSKKKWKFQNIKDAAEFNESLNHFSSSEENELLATNLAKLAQGFERALLWNQQQ